MKFWQACVGLGLIVCGAVGIRAEETRPVTFTKDVAPIVFGHCTTCHRPGEVAPFTMMNYSDVKKRAKDIVNVVEDRLMPPWKAEPGHGEFVGERRLSDQQIRTLRAWVAQGAIEGDAKDLPAMPKFAEGWYLGEPDMIVKMPEAFEVPAEGRDVFRVFVVPMNLPEDKYVSAVEFRPSNRKVVHHALFFLDNSGAARALDERDPGVGYGELAGLGFIPSGGLGGWGPGFYPRPLPEGIARYVRKGSDLVIQTHFSTTGKAEREQSTIGIYFSKTKPKQVLQGSALRSREIDIPPGMKDYVVKASQTVPFDVSLISITPHAHLVCRDMKVWATFPDGSRKDLIWIKDWDWNWQDQYYYKEPVKLPAGTKLDMVYTYDNSSGNPRNPSSPPKRVRNGQQTHDEMAITFLGFVTDAPLAPGQLNAFRGQRPAGALLRRLFGEGETGRRD